jgi:hypothetical protein
VKAFREKIVPVLSHPLVLLLVGAVITDLLVPRITMTWQNQQ